MLALAVGFEVVSPLRAVHVVQEERELADSDVAVRDAREPLICVGGAAIGDLGQIADPIDAAALPRPGAVTLAKRSSEGSMQLYGPPQQM